MTIPEDKDGKFTDGNGSGRFGEQRQNSLDIYPRNSRKEESKIMALYEKPTDDDESENFAKYRLPYALCVQHGINLPKSATPRDARNALNGIGMTAEATVK